MTVTGFYGAFVDLDDADLQDGAPVSAFSAFILRNNLGHLVDCSGQLRIGWTHVPGLGQLPPFVLTNSGDNVDFPLPGVPVVYAQEFPLTWFDENRPANIGLQIGLLFESATNATCEYEVTISPARTPVGEGRGEAIVLEEGTLSEGVTTTVGGFYDMSTDERIQKLRTSFETIGVAQDADFFRAQQLCMLRLDAKFKFALVDGSAENLAYVVGCHLWEYN